MYIEKLYEKGRLGKGKEALRRVKTALRFARDDEFSGFLPSIKCPLGRKCRGSVIFFEKDIDRLDAADRYLAGVRACGPLYFPVVKHFVLDDSNLSAFIRDNFLPNGGRVSEDIYTRLQKGLDLIFDAYMKGNDNG